MSAGSKKWSGLKSQAPGKNLISNTCGNGLDKIFYLLIIGFPAIINNCIKSREKRVRETSTREENIVCADSGDDHTLDFFYILLFLLLFY